MRKESSEKPAVPNFGPAERGTAAFPRSPEERPGVKDRPRGDYQAYTDGEPRCQNGNSGRNSTAHREPRVTTNALPHRAPLYLRVAAWKSPAPSFSRPSQDAVQFLEQLILLIVPRVPIQRSASQRRNFFIFEPQQGQRLIPPFQMPCFLKQRTAAFPILEPLVGVDLVRASVGIAAAKLRRNRVMWASRLAAESMRSPLVALWTLLHTLPCLFPRPRMHTAL